MGERKLKISDLSRETGLKPRHSDTPVSRETAERIELDVMNTLCQYFGCRVADLFEYVPDQ
ncbi:MAG: helix-turn-helix transcriptional regulator [Comamonadaceae bacterium]|nr:helix-turn-helix transcriptional regulator [Comamonadaceae bacterium]